MLIGIIFAGVVVLLFIFVVACYNKLVKAKEQIEDNAMWMFEQDLFASNIYRQRIIANKKSVPKNDYSQELILI